jgi:alpha-N-arabinofuranosidase
MTTLAILLSTIVLHATEYHVSNSGLDGKATPFKTISAAAQIAQPGDIITVHEGVYRERIDPPRGGTSPKERIVYQAAPGEHVVIKGSEVVKGWEKMDGETWKATIPNNLFDKFNPYRELIGGDWFNRKNRDTHPGAVYLNGHWLTEAKSLDHVLKPAGEHPLWFAKANDQNTTIWAQFKGVDPNQDVVEINVRQSVFYPEKPGVNYITVRGFTLEHAATPWAPPTAEQIGLIGTHWSKGWVIENNVIRYSACVGVTLGKYGDEWDNRAPGAAGYVGTINRALANGWSKHNIGHHVVRNNHIYHCEQAGIVGSMGAVFSTIDGNDIHDIHVRRLFSGAEMAGIKIHAAIDVIISNNHIYRTNRGIWLDWMTQGARVTGNLLHDNATEEIQWAQNWEARVPGGEQDLFIEVNHGPLLVDNNIFLSAYSLNNRSQGVAFVHNLFAGAFRIVPYDQRLTPFFKPHSSEIVKLHDNPCGDNQYYYNIFVSRCDLSGYDTARLPVHMNDNVFLNGAKPSKHEVKPLVQSERDPELKLVKRPDGIYLQMKFDRTLGDHTGALVTSEMLGKAIIPSVPYEQPDGTPYRIDTDYFGKKRTSENSAPGPFAYQSGETIHHKVWPKKTPANEMQNKELKATADTAP